MKIPFFNYFVSIYQKKYRDISIKQKIKNLFHEIKSAIKNIKYKLKNLADTNYNLGIYHFHNRNLWDCISRLKFLNFFTNGYKDSYYYIARCYMQNLKYKKAEKYFIKHKQFLGDSNNLAKEVDYCLAVIHRRAGINDIPNSIIASCFNQQACLYDSAIDNTDQSQRDLVSNIVEYVKDAHGKFNILDIGSGFGEVGMLLREYDIVNFLCGVDISEKMTQIAADRAMKDAESKIYNKVICKDIANFNEASGKIGSMKYDIIILSDFITYQSNINNMLLKRLSDLAAQKCLICITFRDIKQLHQYKEGEQVLFHHDTERFYYSDLYIQNLFCDGGFSLLTSQNAQFASNESGFIMQFINYEDVYSKKI